MTSSSTAEQTVSTLLRLLFDTHTSVSDRVQIEQALGSDATLIWIPRNRPLLAASMPLHRALDESAGFPAAAHCWTETARLREFDRERSGFLRITCTVALEPSENARPRSAEVLTVIDKQAVPARILSCAVVYDEAISAISPVSQLSMKRLLTAALLGGLADTVSAGAGNFDRTHWR